MEELKAFPESIQKGTTALFFNTGTSEEKYILPIAEELRNKGISCEIYHEVAKFDKQFKYAERKNIPFVVIIGSKEIEHGTAVIKELASGNQTEMKVDEIIQALGH
jgi:histidyl-tRNA synthetase